ncbi:hemoglobin/transferrin/lactoferrin receptor protein [Ekhidna lutea]|uniref:Hemoglobin/transferrin/lactoferrin receptor protein n=1 Tax=Ekhidna lutea TaxID=447679 RepID=A0A239LL70_EKHLU|nr:TonB-dependent receptor [Ekhidna lutea]SNT30662.1 hemoglobin/transferrin/lactoferrin receptor protein [Ekhidna lutea]
MRLKLKISVLLFITTLFSFSQNALIVDEASRKPIVDVFIYHENKEDVAYTNEKGIADISEFPKGLVFFQHPSFHQQSVAYLGNDLKIALEEKIMSFNEVVISANKWEQNEESVSQQIMTVNRKTVEFQNPQTSADLLAGSGQVYVQKSQLGGGSPKIRGFAANSVLLVVDGVRMNNAIFRSGNLQNVINIDPNALASSEVIFGPGSVIYGSDALGGVMDFHTIDPKWSSDHIADVSANAMARYSTAANERTGHLDVSVAKEKFTFFHSSSFTAFGDLRAGGKRTGGYEGEFERTFYAQRINGEDQLVRNSDINVQKFSGYDLFNTISKTKYRISKNADISYGFYYSTTSDIPRYDNLTETIRPGSDSLAAAEWYYGPQKWQMHNLKLNFYKRNALFDQGKVTLAYQDFEESRNDRRFGDNQLRVRTEQVDMYSLSFDFDKEFSASNLYYGIDFYHNDISSDAFRRNIESGEITSTSSRYPDGGSDFTSLAAYASFVNELTDQVTFNSGLRFNTIRLKAKTTEAEAFSNNASEIDLQNSAFNGSLGLAINLNEESKISYNISSGFRSPNVDDVGKVFDIGNSLVVPNPDLKPEYSLSYEIAYQRKTDRSLFKIVAFHSRLFDAIVDGPFTLNGSSTANINGETLDVFAKVNTGDAEIYGGSMMYRAEIADNWALSKTISYTGGKDITNEEPLRHTTPVFGKVSVTHQDKKFRSEFYIEYNSDRDRDEIPSAEIDRKPYLYTANGSPGWYTLNLKSSYQINEHFKINGGIENILDKHYRPYSSGISAPGRNFILAVRANI